MKKKIIVTGIKGLIGKELVQPLKDHGFDIYAITKDEKNPDNGVHWLKGNLFDFDFLKSVMEEVKPEYLLNMAWITTEDYLNSDINYKFLNAGIELLKYFKNNGGKRAVFAGTCFEYKFKNEPLKEMDELAADKTVYTFCKNKLRETAEDFCKMNDISFGYGRIFYVYGKNENKTRLTGMVIDKLSRDEKVIIKSGNLIRDYMYTKDIAAAFSSFIDSSLEGVINICTGKGISIKDFVLLIAKQLKKEHLVVFEDESLTEPQKIIGDNSRLVFDLGYEIGYKLQDAIKEVVGER